MRSSVLGTFVADGATQNIIVGNITDPILSAYQVRAVATVPEPSGVFLLGLSGITFLFHRRKWVKFYLIYQAHRIWFLLGFFSRYWSNTPKLPDNALI